MKKALAAGFGAALTLASLMGTGTANATPPCQINWELKSDGVCHPYYSTPINGYDPYDPSGNGSQRGLGPDSSWEGESAQSGEASFLENIKANFTSSNGGDQKLLRIGHDVCDQSAKGVSDDTLAAAIMKIAPGADEWDAENFVRNGQLYLC